MAPSPDRVPLDVLGAIVEHSNDAIISRDLEGRILSWNAAAERLFGYRAAEVLGRDSSLIVPPDARAGIEEARARIASGEEIGEIDTVRVTSDGRRIEVSRSMSPLRDAQGKLIGVSFVFRDVGPRKRAERDAARRAALLAALAAETGRAASPLVMLRGCLERICEHGGWRLGHVLMFDSGPQRHVRADSVWKIDDADRERFAAFVDASARYSYKDANGAFAAVMLRAKRPVWIEDTQDIPAYGRLPLLRAQGIRSAFGFPVVLGDDVIALLEFFSDEARCADRLLLDSIGEIGAQIARLIEREREHAALAERERQLRLVAENIPAMIAYFDRDLRCRFANSGYCAFHNVTPEQAAGMRLDEITGAEIFSVIAPAISLVRRGVATTTRREHRTRDGELRHIEIRRVIDRSPEGNFRGYYAMLLDITEQEDAAAKIRASELRLRAILDNEPECVKVVTADGMLVEMNRSGLAMLEAESVEQAREHGLLNFVAPEHRESYAACITRALHGEDATAEFEIIGFGGTRRWLESHATRIEMQESGLAGVLAVTRDISERKRAEAQVAFLSAHDALTGLPNRAVFRDRLEMAVAHARRRGEALGAVLIGLDGFGKFNENLGTRMGDELLRAVATRLRESLREVDTIARVGGDEFAVLVEGIPDRVELIPVAEKLAAALAAPFELLGRELFVSASAGIAVYPGPAAAPSTAAALLESAAAALARLKDEGGGGYQFYEDQPQSRRGSRLELESELRRALANGEIAVHYQPKVNLRSGEVTGAEALARWHSPRLGAVSPVQFIPLAEETGLILPIGDRVLRTACAQAAAWRAAGWPLGISVNLSPRQFRQSDLARQVAEVLAETGLPPEALELEITEGTAMTNAERAVTILGQLHHIGVRLAVDDFGTGYSSLGYLQRFPLDSLKIDRGFVRDIARSASDSAIVRATVALAHSLNLEVVAEGIETPEQHRLLKRIGADAGQGFLYSPALPADGFGALLGERPWVARLPRPRPRRRAAPRAA